METYKAKFYGVTRTVTDVLCIHCNIKFIARVDRLERSKYCSVKCKKQAVSIKKSTEVSCSNCDCKFRKKNSSLINSKSGLYFCTRECKDKAQKLGGIKEIMPPHYGTAIDRNYQYLIENTNNPICCGCNENKPYLLCVHHIDGNHENDIIENLEIVCFNCHVKRHLKIIDGKWSYSTRVLTPRDKLDEI
jgi:hypothetical protein